MPTTASRRVYVDFDVKTNPDTDQVLSQLRVSQAQAQLPAQVNTAGVTVQKSLTSPLMLIGLSSPDNKYSVDFLTNYEIINLQDELTRVPGVARIQVFGGQYALRVWVKPDQLAKLGVTATDVINALQVQNNVNPAARSAVNLFRTASSLHSRCALRAGLSRRKSLATSSSALTRTVRSCICATLRALSLGTQTYNLTARYNNAPAGIMAVYQLPGSNAVKTAAAVTKRLQELSATFPAGMRYDIPLDTTKAVTAGIHEIVVTLLIALALVILVVYIFLQGWRATLIPLMAVPVSLIGTFIIFPLLGFSINTLSLFGLVLAIGLVVDDAIIVVEAVEHHIDEGMTPSRCSVQGDGGSRRPGRGDCADSRGCVHPDGCDPWHHRTPLSAIRNHDCNFSADFGVQRAHAQPSTGCRSAEAERCDTTRRPIAALLQLVQSALWPNYGQVRVDFGVLIHKSGITMLALLGVAILAVFVGGRLPTGFLPQEDQGYLFVAMQLPDAASLQRTDSAVQRVTKALLETPGISGVVGVDGFSLLTQTQSTNSAFFFVSLKPWEVRKTRAEQIEAIQASVQQKLAGVSEGLAFSFPPPQIPGIGTSGGVTMILQDRSGNDDPTFLTKNVFAFLGAVSKRPEIAAAVPSYLPAVPQLYADVDRDKASQQQVELSSIYTTLQTFMGGYLVNYFNRFGRQWQTFVEAEGDSRTNIQNINQFYVRSANGSQVPLGSLVHVKQITGPEFVLRFNEYNAAQINISGVPGYSSGQVRAALEEGVSAKHAGRNGLLLPRHELPGRARSRRSSRMDGVRSFTVVCLPHPRCAL